MSSATAFLWDATDENGIVYPCSDGRPMSDNTIQFEWIQKLHGNLDIWFRNDPNVFVAGDHLIYTVKGNAKRRRGPDVYVAFGRPKGHRGSYRVWDENGIFPQVIFEVLSPSNTRDEMRRKKLFYRIYGAEEYYIIDSVPDVPTLEVWLRQGKRFIKQNPNGFVSPRMNIRFQPSDTELAVFLPDGRPFLSMVELGTLTEAETARADAATDRADEEAIRADAEKKRADALAAKLRALGIDPDA